MKTTSATKALTHLPVLPEGQFWRVTRDIYTRDTMMGDSTARHPYQFQVQLCEPHPVLFNRKHIRIIATEEIHFQTTDNLDALAAGAAAVIIERRADKATAIAQAEAISGDYITVKR